MQPEPPRPPRRRPGPLLLILLACVAALAGASLGAARLPAARRAVQHLLARRASERTAQVPLSEFLRRAESGAVTRAALHDAAIEFQTRDGARCRAAVPAGFSGSPQVLATLARGGAHIEVPQAGPERAGVAVALAIAALIAGVIVALRRRGLSSLSSLSEAAGELALGGGARGAVVTFADVAGVDEAKDEVREIVDFLRDPGRFTALGGRPPRGVLLSGPPGTGKTLLARSIAGEAGVPFLSASGADFVEMFAGVGAARVRRLFRAARRHRAAIIFIDELDCVGRRRSSGAHSHEEREQTLNQLLVELDGFRARDGVVVIAATNRRDILDPALLRPGRFDRQVVVGCPDLKGREDILRVHCQRVPLAADVDLRALARGTPGLCGAELANLVNEAALLAARAGRSQVGAAELSAARDKVLMGAERRSLVMSEAERAATAYHEAGHALVAALSPHADPLHKVTIVPRGQALGLTMQLPVADRHMHTASALRARLAVLLGGRAAEELRLGEVTSGAANDIERATALARTMVCALGMSALGPLCFGGDDEASAPRPLSEETARRVDDEVRRLVLEGQEAARELLTRHAAALEALAQALLAQESLEADALRALLQRHGAVVGA